MPPIPTKLTAAFGVYPNFVALRASVSELQMCGFGNGDISVLFPERTVARTLSGGGHGNVSARTGKHAEPLIGGTLGWLSYLGPTEEGIVSQALETLGVPETEANRYEKQIRRGRLLVCVRSASSEQTEVAKQILERTGAHLISSSREIETDAAIDRADPNRPISKYESAPYILH